MTWASRDRATDKATRQPARAGGRLRRFNPWRRAASATLEGLIADVVRTVADDAVRGGRWRRRPRADDLPILHRQIEAVIADLAHLYRVREDRSDELVISRDKGFLGYSRYRRADVETRAFPRVLDALEVSGFVRHTHGLPRYVADEGGPDADDADDVPEGLPVTASTLRAAPALLAAFQSFGLSANDIGAVDGRERVTLMGRRRPGGYRELIEYRDTAHTRALRADMDAIDAWLASFAVTLEGDHRPAGPLRQPLWASFVYEGRARKPQGTPDVFGHAGRLHGGLLETLPRAALRIDGEPAGIVDFGGTQPRPLRDQGGAILSALLRCKADGLCVVPMDDGLLTTKEDVDRAAAIVRDVFREQMGADTNVSGHRQDTDRDGGARA
jgi:hypothetical protein